MERRGEEALYSILTYFLGWWACLKIYILTGGMVLWTFLRFNGTVQRKQRWVENGICISRQVLWCWRVIRHCFRATILDLQKNVVPLLELKLFVLLGRIGEALKILATLYCDVLYTL
jgi:hypothetical protein